MAGLNAAEKTEMFVHMRQSYGRSALMLSGGGGLGVYHIGVVKALFEAGLMPRIVSGSSAGSNIIIDRCWNCFHSVRAGALVGAALCVSTTEEIEEFFKKPQLKSHYMLSAPGQNLSFLDRIMHLFKFDRQMDLFCPSFSAFFAGEFADRIHPATERCATSTC